MKTIFLVGLVILKHGGITETIITLDSNAIPVSYLFHIYFGRSIWQEEKMIKKLYQVLTFIIT